jgi:hypothetical protein
MALTLSRVKEVVIGNLKMRILDVTFDAAYASGGESLTADDLGVDPVFVLAEPTDGYVFEYDKGNSKLIAYEQTDPAAVGGANVPLVEAAGDLSTVVVRTMAIGV